ncbi:MAG TPA: response regulator [Bryobacteraceae bacterium]|nr:response regulator [Bryobacteraceae bacterium]
MNAVSTQQQFSVLVVDDEAALRKVIRSSLAANGFTVEEATTGGDALEVVTQRRFDLILLDVNMPGVSGFDACRQIRALAPRTGIINGHSARCRGGQGPGARSGS